MSPKYENKKLAQGFHYIIGCDEVGRGCLAGPVVAGAVILDLSCKIEDLRYIKDSKLLTPEQRVKLEPIIKQSCVAWGIGMVDERQIDEINIHNASLLAMRLAVESLLCHCEGVHPTEAIYSLDKIASSPVKALAPRNDRYFLFVDGKFPIPNIHVEQEAVVDGDNKILSVAAASIIAKVFRDELMQKYHKQYPIYNFAQHKGYATFHHRQMIAEHGLSKIHRLSFCEHLKIPA